MQSATLATLSLVGRAGERGWSARGLGLVVDVGPGHSHLALDLMLAADFAVCVTVPEPPAIEATYRFVRAAYPQTIIATEQHLPFMHKPDFFRLFLLPGNNGTLGSRIEN